MKMKTLYTILFLVCFGFAHSQPQKINYQAVAIDASGLAVKNKTISVRLSILDSSSTGTVLYSETHQPITDGSGQFSVYLGGGTVVSGTFSNIPWGNTKAKFLKTESDYTGSSNYLLMGVSQLVSVPYALAAGSLTEGAIITGINGSQYVLTIGNNGPGWVLSNGNGIFQCGQSLKYSGENYSTIQIGNQCWFQKNLNIGTMISSTGNQTNNSILEKFCYNNDSANCAIYGGLYQWSEAVSYKNNSNNSNLANPSISGNVQGICPSGWHIPNDAEFCTLTTFLDSFVQCSLNSFNIGAISYFYQNTGSNIGDKMKSNSNLWTFPGVNSSGYTTLPSGFYDFNNGYYNGLNGSAFFWTSTEIVSNRAFSRRIDTNTSIVRYDESKYFGFSVRCLKD
jgi:uncharacterized protein (TIGR02145 family)